jgi:Ca2+-binding RTX toxin-like protein
MDGGIGNDVFYLSSGFDTATGGTGADVFTFLDKTRGATITDWEDGSDLIDFTRADNVGQLSDLTIVQTSGTTATITFENDKGRDVEIDLISGTDFSLTVDDFVFA